MPAVKAVPAKKRSLRKDSDSTPLILPAFRPPQLATLERKVPTGDSWLFEIKFDGYRMQAAIAGDQVRLYTRNGHDWTKQFGYVAPALSKVTKGTALIDGELCAMDETGKPKALLANVPPDAPIAYSEHIVGDGEAVFRAVCKQGFEGVVAKSPTARYYGGDRSTAWLKIKCVQRQEFVVIGWRPPGYGVDDVRGLLLATQEDGELVYRDGVGTGFTNKMRREVREVLRPLGRRQHQSRGG